MTLFGIENEKYNLISVVYHLLQGVETTGKYIKDVKKIDDEVLLKYFKDVQDQYVMLADRGRILLKEKI